jgi:radical SAM superfamily enzyme YgiQ (UPF0313 family)
MEIVLFVNGDTNSDKRFYVGEKRTPAGIGSLFSLLRNNGHKVYLCDRFLNSNQWVDVANADFIGVYCSSVCFNDAKYILERANKSRKKGSVLAVGGPHAALHPDQFPEYVDYVVKGEGEPIILKLLNKEIKERIIQVPRMKDLDDIPFLPWDEFVKYNYCFNSSFDNTYPTYTMNTSRGCPFSCSFCHVKDIWGRKIIGMSSTRIIEEIKYLIKNHNAKGIYFREDLFTYSKKRVVAFCEELNRQNIKIKWYCETRVDLEEDIIKLMSESGCSGLYVGVESGSQKMLNVFNKNITVEQIEKFFYLINKYNIASYASFVVDHPLETKEDRAMTDQLLARINPTKFYMNTFRSDF